jgi:transforming growth factor-beta-induced protein
MFRKIVLVIVLAATMAVGLVSAQDAPTQNLVEIAVGNEDFSTLVELVTAAGLVDVLADPNASWTVFAPTNDAFELVPAPVLEALAADPALLTRVLTYHVVNGAVLSTDVVGMLTENMAAAESMEMEAVGSPTTGSELTFTATAEGDLYVDSAKVIAADIVATNGVIHVIDRVIIPDEIAAAVPGILGVDADVSELNIAEIASANENFSTLASLVSAAGLVDVLADPDASWTVFAPTNEAFAAVPQEVLDTLAADPALLTRVLTYHVVEGAVLSTDVVGMAEEMTANAASMEMEAVGSPTTGSELTFTVLASGDIRVDDSRVLVADIAASNGVIHIIDSVLVPAEIAAMLAPEEEMGEMGGEEMTEAPTQNIVEIAAGNPDFSTLVSLVSAAGLVDVLADPNASWTVFAPTNEAFSRVPQAVLDQLAADPALLTRVLTYHVVEGAVTSDSLSDMMVQSMEMEAVGSPTTGSELSIALDDMGVTVDGVRVIAADILATNGVIHVIDSVLIPADIAAMLGEG